jgi:protease IV
MRPSVNAARAAAFALAAVALPASAQVQNAIDRDAGLPAGIALPVPGVAVAEEPSALGTNPAGIGFVPRLALQWFHENAVTPGSRADGIWAATGIGPLGVGFARQWIRPGDERRRYGLITFGLSTGDHHAFSLGFAWNWWSSPDRDVDRLASWDMGLTVRPARFLSIGAAMRNRDARLGGTPLPVRYDLGIATRVWGDTLTLSADLLADDRRRDDFRATHVAFGAGAEVGWGLALAFQIQVPFRATVEGPARATSTVAISWNAPTGGWTGGVTPVRDRTGWLLGARASTEHYRAPEGGRAAPVIDVPDALSPPRTILFLTFGDPDPYGTLLRKLHEIRDDPGVAALVLRIDDLPIGAGRAEELRSALLAVRERKPVLAYLVGGGTREYWVATGASAIAAQPGSAMFVNGLSTSTFFVRDALARLGVMVEVVKRGAYKSAPEPLVRSGPSPEASEATNALLDDLYGRFVADVAASRGLPEDRVRALVDQGLLGAEEARDAKLVDALLWPDEIEGWARAVARRRVDLKRGYGFVPRRTAEHWGPETFVEVIRVEGTIASGKSRGAMGVGAIAGADTIAAQVRRAAEDRSVRAIVVRVDSPGGDGAASDVIWREIVRARQRKPVIASMGDYAASGGYLVAVGADAIVAEPTTLTGSIGVFALKPDLSGLLAKLSVSRQAYARGQNAQLTSLTKAWTPSERAAVERQIEAFYARFVGHVAEGRRLPRAEVEGIAGGRVWSGRQAYDRKLVDRIGSLDDAIALAKERARLHAHDRVVVRRARGVDASVGAMVSGTLASLAPEPPLARVLSEIPEVRVLALLGEIGPVVALPEEWVSPGRAP